MEDSGKRTRMHERPRLVRLRRAPSTDAERLEAITHFAHKKPTTAVYRREANGARASVNLLLNSLGPVLNLTYDDVKSIVERALEETGEVFQAMNVPMDHLRLKRQTEAALAGAHRHARRAANPSGNRK